MPGSDQEHCQHSQNHKNRVDFSAIYDETVQAVGEPVPRRKRPGRGWENLGVNQHQEGDEETVASFRRLYFQIVDSIVLHMTQRFAVLQHML